MKYACAIYPLHSPLQTNKTDQVPLSLLNSALCLRFLFCFLVILFRHGLLSYFLLEYQSYKGKEIYISTHPPMQILTSKDQCHQNRYSTPTSVITTLI